MISRLVLAAALLSSACVAQEKIRPLAYLQDDSRYIRLTKYLENCDCPAAAEAARFVEEADAHLLDWRLLPSLTIVETGGGKHVSRLNNWFGWDNGNARFVSVDLAIHTVAERLTESERYRDLGMYALLRQYNRNPAYALRVIRVMRRFAPDPVSKKEGMYVSKRASKDVVLADLNLDRLVEGLESAKENLREFVNPDGAPPDSIQLAEGFYHVAAAAALLNEPEVAAAAMKVIGLRPTLVPASEAPVDEMELVGEAF